MSEKLKDVMAYLLKQYADKWKDGLVNTMLNNAVYLCDWHQAVKYGKKITDIEWHFSKHDNAGLYVRDIEKIAIARKNSIFGVKPRGNKTIFSLKEIGFQPQLTNNEKDSLDIVIRKTKKLSYDVFMERVNKTYPVSFFEKGQPVDLVKMAKEWRKKIADRCV